MKHLFTNALATALLVVIFASQSFAQAPSIQWQKSFGGSDYDQMNGADPYLQTSDGGFLINGVASSTDGDVTGNHGSYDFWLLKSDADGNLSWQKSLGGSGYDNGVSAQQTADGGYILVGYGSSNDGDVSGNHGAYDGWVVKLDADRNIVWQRTLGGSSFDYLWSIQQTSDGGYIIAGETGSNDGDVTGNHGSSDAWVVRLDANGNILWKKCFGGSGSDGANSIQQTTDGGFIVGAFTASTNGDLSFNYGSDDYWIFKLDAVGNIVWQKVLGGSSVDVCQSVQQTSDGGYIAAGYSTSNDGLVSGNHGGGDDWIVRLDANGTFLWQKALGGSSGEYTFSAEPTTDGGYVVGGYTYSNDGDVSGNHGGVDYWTVKLDGTGNISWQKTLGGSGDDYGQNVTPTADGGYIVSGFSNSNDGDVSGNHGSYDYWMVKLAGCTGASTPTITASTNPVCPGTSTMLSISGGDLHDQTQWQWYSGACGSENGTSVGSGNSITVSPAEPTTYYVRGEGGCASPGSCGQIAIDLTVVPGDPNAPGDHVWNVYAYNDGDASASSGRSWNNAYSGYYVDSNLNFNTNWPSLGSPSDAPGYQGCTVNDDNHSWSAIRRGFPCGVYSIDIPGHDDEAQLYINGLEAWHHDGCCDSHPNVWTGSLNDTTVVVYRGTEGSGDSYGIIQFNLISATTFYADADMDGYGDPNSGVQSCSPPPGYISDNTDCDDGNNNVHPGVADVCNGVDDNCDGVIDENAIVATIFPSGTINSCKGTPTMLNANTGTGISYQWIKNGVDIAGATDASYDASKTGNYQVRENNTFSCDATSASTIIKVKQGPDAIITALGDLNICTTHSVTLQANDGSGLTYQWLKGKNNIGGATNRNYTATTKGTYKCIVSNANLCSKTSDGLKVTKTCSRSTDDVNITDPTDLSVYPNPSSGTFTLNMQLENTEDDAFKLVVTNIVGQVIDAENGTLVHGELQKEISLPSDLVSGIYMISVTVNGETYQSKMVVQR